jgi:hypothetical protein
MPTTNTTPIDNAAYGARVQMSWPGRTTLSARQWWSGFDDYLALQRVLADHEDTVLERGRPANGLGATIAFEFMGGTMREVLIAKDDVRYIWKISMPEPNPMFLCYEGTARIDAADDAGCDVSYSIDFVLASTDRAARLAILNQAVPPGQPTRVDEVSRFVLNRDGVRNQFTFPVDCPLDQLWAVVGDWSGVGWVQGASKAEVLPTGRRLVTMEDGTRFEERLWSRDDQTCTLVYEPIMGPMPVRMYLGTVQLQAISGTSTQVTYSQVFIPKDGLDPMTLKGQLADGFRGRFRWIQQKFDGTAAR